MRGLNRKTFGVLDFEIDSALKELNALDFSVANVVVLALDELAIKMSLASSKV